MKKLYTLAIILATTTLSWAQTADVNPYITKVYEFHPAPGQFVNVTPEYIEGETYADMLERVEESIVGTFYGAGNNMNEVAESMISLGGFGGYVVFGFSHPIYNVGGAYDFRVLGNAIQSSAYPDIKGGSSEPGIVWVMHDDNGNGLPDDTWYELAGSDYNLATTQKKHTITYHRPVDGKTLDKLSDDPTVWDATYIRYSGDDEGYVYQNVFHKQSYWPGWLADEEELTFSGTRLAPNGQNMNGGTGAKAYWLLKELDWGYADNAPNSTDPGFDIDWAVDETGKKVHLEKIHFVKVQCAMMQYCGQLGETSTEVAGAEDLHPEATSGINSATAAEQSLRVVGCAGGVLSVSAPRDAMLHIAGINGAQIAQIAAHQGVNRLNVSHLETGVYVVSDGAQCCKFVKH